MSKSISRNQPNVLPLQPEQELENEIEKTEERFRKLLDQRKRKHNSNLLEIRRMKRQGLECNTVGNASYEEALEAISGEESWTYIRRTDENGEVTEKDPFKGECDLAEFLQHFFYDGRTVQDVQEIELINDGNTGWTESYMVSGYGHPEHDSVEFGPAGVFEGPPLRYAFVCYSEEEDENIFDESTVQARDYHPDAKLTEYSDPGQHAEEILEKGAEQVLRETN